MRPFMRWSCVCLMAGFACMAVRAQGLAPTSADVRKSIAAFLSDPLKESSKDEAKKIVQFATESSDVLIVLGEEETSWLKEKAKSKKDYGGLLLTAFIAGNVQAQLDIGEKRNDVYSGAVQVMRVYRDLRKSDPDFRSPGVEDLLRRHREGTLLRHLADLQEKRDLTRPKGVKQ